MNYKYTILYIFVSLFLFWVIIKWGQSLITNNLYCVNVKEGLTGNNTTDFEKYSQQIVPYPKDAEINYNDLNSPLYSHTVNLPINDPVSCKNFCGPKAQCAITREQCTADIDCQGCNPGPTKKTTCDSKDVEPYDATGKLGQNLQYSPLTTGYNNHVADFEEVYPGSKNAQLKRTYEGVDLWTDSFNKGLEFYNKKRESYDRNSEGISNAIRDERTTTDIRDERFNKTKGKNEYGNRAEYKSKFSYYEPIHLEPKYPTTISATGLFYETTPPSSNSYLL